MTIQAVLAPLFVQVALTFALLLWMGSRRVGAIQRGEVAAGDIALGQKNWSERTLQVGNAFQSQFELPLLFYVLIILAWITRQADLLFVVMAWLFVAFRIIHAVIHTTSNRVSQRFLVFLLGAAVLVAMWGIFALRILLAPMAGLP
ncbi:MAG TPA: MAPEG family protein [Xanthobacteraceae bacterium]|nr:MAPEG family protein [Xanthobacteraceae bacterium]